jgi:hypothetical protein
VAKETTARIAQGNCAYVIYPNGLIENRSFGSAAKNDILLPAIKTFAKAQIAKQSNPKTWKFDETP